MAPVELHKNGGGWACVVINTVFAHSISPNNKPSVSNNVMISWNDFANLKMSPANLISALTKAKSKPTSFPPHVRHLDIAEWSTEKSDYWGGQIQARAR